MKLQERFKAFVDGEVSGTESLAIRKHLNEFPEDQTAVEDLARLSASIREYVTRPEPIGLEATLAALDAAKPDSQRVKNGAVWGRRMKGFGIAFACLLVLFFVLPKMAGLNRSSSDSSTATLTMLSSASSPQAATVPAPQAYGSSEQNQAREKVPMGGALSSEPGSSGTLRKSDLAGAAPMKGAMGGFGGARERHGSFGAIGRSGKLDSEGAGGVNSDSQTVTRSDLDQAPSPRPSRTRALIQKTASLGIKVKNVAESQHSVESIAVGNGGFVEQSNRNEGEGQKAQADVTVRVPVQNFESAIRSLRGLGEVVSDSSSGNDVTGDVVDMDARLKVLRAEESDYVALLGRARSIAAIMEIKDKLTEIREEIESIDSQRKSTKDLATYSTIAVSLTQNSVAKVEPPKPPQKDTWLSDTWTNSIDGLSAAGRVIGQFLIFALVWSPIWVPITLLSMYLYRRTKW